MERNFVFLCDSAQESGGKLHALGIGINRVFGQELPVAVPRLMLVAQLSYGVGESGAKRMRIETVDADGAAIMQPAEGEIVFPDVASLAGASGIQATANVIVSLESPKFPAFGLYEVRLDLDSEEIATLPLEVVRWQPPAGAGPAGAGS